MDEGAMLSHQATNPAIYGSSFLDLSLVGLDKTAGGGTWFGRFSAGKLL